MIWYSRVQSPALSKQDERWCSFRWSIPLSIDYVWYSCIDRVISTPSCSYCIWNRNFQNHHRILPNFLLFVWFDTVEFNRRPCPNDKMNDDVVIAVRFRYQSAMCDIRVLIGLYRLVHAHIAYEIDTSKIIAEFCRLSHCLYDLIRLNSIACRVQTITCTMIWFSPFDSDINWLCLKYVYW